jgi:hypothetical protein
MSFESKLDNILKFMRDLETNVDKVDSEIERLSKIKKQKTNAYAYLKNYVSNTLQAQ